MGRERQGEGKVSEVCVPKGFTSVGAWSSVLWGTLQAGEAGGRCICLPTLHFPWVGSSLGPFQQPQGVQLTSCVVAAGERVGGQTVTGASC